MSTPSDPVCELSGGDIVVWVGEGGGAIMLKARTPHDDPVELNAEEVKELCAVRLRMVRQIE